MWVRSQDKTQLVNADYFRYSQVNHKYYYIMVSGKIDFAIGRYSTKEKALKVLDMIEEHISYQNVMVTVNNEIIPFKPFIFKMPLDSEVE